MYDFSPTARAIVGEGQTEIFEVENHPNHPEMGKREIPFSRDLWIEQDDFMEEKVGKFFRLFPGNEVRLKGAYVVTTPVWPAGMET